MIDDDDEMHDDAIESVTVIDKLDVLISLIKRFNPEKQVAILSLLEETKFHLFHAWNEANYYRELCESYETAINKVVSGLK
jgi:hypothetical protein